VTRRSSCALAVVIPLALPHIVRGVWRYAATGQQQRTRRYLRQQWKQLAC
jgi:hypothetical protein